MKIISTDLIEQIDGLLSYLESITHGEQGNEVTEVRGKLKELQGFNWKKFEPDTMPKELSDLLVIFTDSNNHLSCFLDLDGFLKSRYRAHEITPSMRWIYLSEIPKPTE